MTADDDASSAFDELADEFVARVRAGEEPDIAAYARAHPDLAADIEKLFPLLAMVEGAKADTVAGGGGAQEEAMPTEVGGYTIVRELGRGGMGMVYEGTRDDERVAIKLIHSHLLSKTSFLDRFLREAEVGTRVRHPNVVRTIAAGTTDAQQPYLVMEYVEGQNLRDLLDEVTTVPERLRRHIGACVADALAAIHEQGIVHRDVKPENVVITAEEEVKLMDLGVALVQDEATRLSRTGEFVGSLLYASPEQMRGTDIGPPTDLYALGLLLFELGTGEHPLRVAEGGRAVPQVAAEAPSARERNPRVSHFYDAVIRELLVLDPEARLGDAERVSQILAEGEQSAWWRAKQRPDHLWHARVGYDPLAGHVPLVGRAAELDALREAYAGVRAGRGQVVGIVGEAGLGKSRLVREWLTRAATEPGARAIVATHDPESDTYSIPPLARAFAEAVGPDVPTERLAELLGPSAGLAEAYGNYLRADAAGPYGTGLPATAVTTATVRLARGLAEAAPYVLVIEDLHFASAHSRDLCLQVARGLQEHPVFVLLTSRPVTGRDPLEALLGWPHARTLELEPLDNDACHQLLKETAEEDAGAADRVELIRRAEGNPLYLLELARTLATSTEPVKSATVADEAAMPETLRGMLESRLAGLEDEQRELLSIAACVGNEFDPVLVADALESSRMKTLKDLGRIERGHALIESVGRNYRFAHHLVLETLYAELHDALREAYHGAIARSLEARENKRGLAPDEVPGRLATSIAFHALRGEDPALGLRYAPPALRYLWETRDSQREHDIASALLALDDALEPPMRARALLHLGNAALETEPTSEILAHMDEALELLEGHAHPFVESRARGIRAFMCRGLGRLDEALAEAQRALAVAQEAGDARYEAEMHRGIGGTLRQLGRNEESLAAIRESLRVAVECGSVDEECSARNSLGIRLQAIGAYTIALDMYEGALTAARACGKRSTESTVLNNSSRALTMLGRLDEAEVKNAESLAVAREMGHLQLESRAVGERGVLRTLRGRYADSAADRETAARLTEEKEWLEEARVYRLGLARQRFHLGDLAGAAEALEVAVKHSERAGGRPFERHVQLTRAELAAAVGDLEASRAHWEAATQDWASAKPPGEGPPRYPVGQRIALFAERYSDCRDLALAELEELQERENRVDRASGHALACVALWKLGEETGARTQAEAAFALANEIGLPWPSMVGEAVLAALGIEDALAARLRLETEDERMPWWARMLAWHAVHSATGADADRDRAVASIAPAEHIDAVPLFATIAGRATG